MTPFSMKFSVANLNPNKHKKAALLQINRARCSVFWGTPVTIPLLFTYSFAFTKADVNVK